MTRKCVLLLTIVLSVFSSLSLSSFEANADPAIGATTTTIYSVADARVNSSSPGTNYGDETDLYVSSNSEVIYTYVMFNLSSIPPGANIISAKLELYLEATGGAIYWYPADEIGAYYCSDNSWTELGITWNNKPNFNLEPTDTWSFSILYSVQNYKSWDVTEDVRAALPSRNLTEVLKFKSKTDYGYAIFHSREKTNKPKLEVEYAELPVFVVHLESIQDAEITSNLGHITFADYTFSLPTDIDVVAGSYLIRYSDGYMFMRWETSGGVIVPHARAATTTVTISGEGTLRAMGNAKRLEYTYDHGQPGWGSETAGCVDAVQFTPLFSGQLLMARFYMHDISSYQSNTFKVHIMNENREDLITPFERTPTSKGWLDVDLSSYGISVNKSEDFHIGMEWMVDYNPVLGEDRTRPSDRSWHWNGTHWEEETYSDFMIRAVVGTLIDHVTVADGIVFHIPTESNSTISNFQFVKEDKKLLFNVTGPTDTYAFCNITIPNQLLGGPFNVAFDEQILSEVLSFDNGTHTWLHFSYPQSEHRIEIVGSTVIPEFPSLLLPLLCLITTLVALVFKRKFKPRTKP